MWSERGQHRRQTGALCPLHEKPFARGGEGPGEGLRGCLFGAAKDQDAGHGRKLSDSKTRSNY